MRTLFLSEKRCISNLMWGKWGVTLESDPIALKESSWDPFNRTRPPKFNSDFILDFVDDFTAWPDRAGTMNPILPNTLGAEAYLYVETTTFTPLHFELLGGAAFSIRYYSPYIATVETAIIEAAHSQQVVGTLSQSELLQRVSIKKSGCARVLVVGGDVCFLYFPSEAVPVMRGSRFDLDESDDRHIGCYLDGDEVVCFDGWIRTEVTRSDSVLVMQSEE